MFKTLTLNSVTRSFGAHNALNGLSLTVDAGEFVSLLGPSGCGKSTALNCLAGLLPLTAGEIWVDERRVDILPPERRGFGMVFQNYALFPHMSVARNIGFGLDMRKVPRPERARRVDAALDLIRLKAHAGKLPGQLSGGQQQRVAIARAIVIEPPLVLMDEPLSNLDAALRLEMREEILRIHRSLGLTTIYVTHDQDEALSMSDRIVVMKDGVMQQAGRPEELYRRPVNLDVARFMGCRNTLEVMAGARISDGTVELSTGDFALRGMSLSALRSEAAVAVFRPDDAAISSEGGLPGRVTDVVYGGKESTLKVELANGATVQVRAEARPAVGARIHVQVPADRLLVFPRPSRAVAGGHA